jgi:hypothetical protein
MASRYQFWLLQNPTLPIVLMSFKSRRERRESDVFIPLSCVNESFSIIDASSLRSTCTIFAIAICDNNINGHANESAKVSAEKTMRGVKNFLLPMQKTAITIELCTRRIIRGG